MNVAGFRKKISEFLALKPGTGLPPQQGSLVFATCGDKEYQMRHAVQDLVETMGASASVQECLEEDTEGMSDKELTEYFRAMAPGSNVEMNSDFRVQSNALILLARNVKVVMDAYMMLGSPAKLEHAQQEKLLAQVRRTPEVMLAVEKHMANAKEDFAGDMEAAREMAALERLSQQVGKTVSEQLRELDGGPGRGGSGDTKKKP